VNLRFIEAFVWVARLHSFTAAAEKLFTTQAAISARIATLETEFGVKLFKRDKRTVVLTRSGEELLKYAEQLLGISVRMSEAVADRASYSGRVAIGAIEAVVHTWLPELIRSLQKSFPKARVEIHSYMTADLYDELLKGNIDVALTAESLSMTAVDNFTICEFEMGWIRGRGGELKSRSKDGRMLERFPILTFLPDSLVYRDVVRKLGQHSAARINPISSIAAMVALLKSGYGVATLPHAAVWRELKSGALVALDVQPRLAALPIIASVRSQSDSALAEAVVSFALESVRTFAVGPLLKVMKLNA